MDIVPHNHAARMHKYSSTQVAVSIVGARGYTGLELARLLLKHPHANLISCFNRQEFNLSSYVQDPALFSRAKQVKCLPESEIFSQSGEVVFLATPAETSHELAPKLLDAGKTVIDLSGAFRLKAHSYQTWYNFKHEAASALKSAQYGLVPWSQPPAKSKKGSLVANPGCYATATLMALLPLIKEKVINPAHIVVDAKSGTSGGGRKASENLLFMEVAEDCLPYKVGKHQHLPEIIEAVAQFTGVQIDPHFSTSLLPIRRGITSAVYCELNNGITLDQVEKAFALHYEGSSLISFGSLEKNPELLSVRRVTGTGRTHIAYKIEGKKLFVFSCIDNLLKGAASQAIENFNRDLDLPSSTGLQHLEALV